MRKSIKVALLVFAGFAIVAVGIYLFVLNAVDVDMEPSVNSQTVVFDELEEKVYLRAMAWGIAGNHNEVILSTEPIEPETRKSEKRKDYIFSTTEVYYKKQGVDTLLVYAEASFIGKPPGNLSDKIKIVPMKLNTYDESLDYQKNYKEYGLSKISVYPSK